MSLSTEIERYVMIAETKFTVEDFRKRIQAVSDETLIRFGKAAAWKPRVRPEWERLRCELVARLLC
jgi:hypothetical protein